MDKLKFSVAMCVYNGDNPAFFDEALESVFNQTLCPYEVVLQVDGPVNDNIEKVIEKYQNKYDFFKVFRLEKNSGHGIARNECINHCSCEIVAIADADDINRQDRFEKQIEHFKNNTKLSAVSSACYHFSNSINEILNEEKIPLTDSEIKEFMKKRCPMCQASTMFKKEDVLRAGGYQDWYQAEDYYLWVRMYLCGCVFENDEECLIFVRSTQEQSRRRGGYKYFLSLKKLYDFMLKNKVINVGEYIFNVCTRFFIQVCISYRMRLFIRKHFL